MPILGAIELPVGVILRRGISWSSLNGATKVESTKKLLTGKGSLLCQRYQTAANFTPCSDRKLILRLNDHALSRG